MCVVIFVYKICVALLKPLNVCPHFRTSDWAIEYVKSRIMCEPLIKNFLVLEPADRSRNTVVAGGVIRVECALHIGVGFYAKDGSPCMWMCGIVAHVDLVAVHMPIVNKVLFREVFQALRVIGGTHWKHVHVGYHDRLVVGDIEKGWIIKAKVLGYEGAIEVGVAMP